MEIPKISSAGPVVIHLSDDEDEGSLDACLAEIRASQVRQAERETQFPGTPRQKMTVLCRLFPTLRAAKGIDPWSFDHFVLWALNSVGGSGQGHAVRFVLNVWNSKSDKAEFLKCEVRRPRPEAAKDRVLWDGLQKLRANARRCLADRGEQHDTAGVEALLDDWFSLVGPFNVTDAISTWDEKHCEAFRKWAAFPFFP